MRQTTRELWRRLGAGEAADGEVAPLGVLGGDGAGGLTDAVVAAARRQYEELFAAMPVPAYLTFGNVDVPDLWPENLAARLGGRSIGAAVEIGGAGFGFVGGAGRRPGSARRTRWHPRTTRRRSPPRARPPARRAPAGSTCCAATSRRRCPS